MAEDKQSDGPVRCLADLHGQALQAIASGSLGLHIYQKPVAIDPAAGSKFRILKVRQPEANSGYYRSGSRKQIQDTIGPAMST